MTSAGFAIAAFAVLSLNLHARDLRVGIDPEVPTIHHAIKLAGPGDTIHLEAGKVYHDYAGFYGKKGEPGKPITFDGHGATLEGSDPLDPAQWTEVSPGHFTCARLMLAIPATAAGPLEIGSRLEPFVDRHLVERFEGTELKLNPPNDEGEVLRFDRPWEGVFSGYGTVLHEGDRYRLYYRGKPDFQSDGVAEVVCYAESSDGIRWERPSLGLHEYEGSSENNIILTESPIAHNFSPFIDVRSGVPAEERFKALGGAIHKNPGGGLFAFASGDGIHWRKLSEKPVITEGAFDSQNLAFWSTREGRYVAYFRAPHFYLATAARFVPSRSALSIEETVALGVPERYAKAARDTTDPVLLSSRDGETYDQTFRESLVPPGLRPEEWVSRSNYPLLNLVQTEPEEMSFYIQHDYGAPSAHVRRYSWELDRIASVTAGYEGGEFVTRPLIFTGGRLHLNFSTSAVGSIRIEIQDESGTAIPGFALGDSTELIGNRLDHVATWGERDDLSSLAGKTLRLRFVMKGADLYALQFAE